MDLSVIIVTSPSISNPDTYLIDTTLNSLSLIHGLSGREGERGVEVFIVLDGYSLHSSPQTKKGRITKEMEENYELYYHNLLEKYCDPRYHVIESDSHLGFALSVKMGLEACQTKYALILQHDRRFCVEFPYIHHLLDLMAIHSHIRYIGFPTISSKNHCLVLQSRYGLGPLLSGPNSKIPLNSVQMNGEGLIDIDEDRSLNPSPPYDIQPIIFWYDSNHLCHVQRYLEIYTPFRALPTDLRIELEKFDRQLVGKLVLKRGDFIEDRFGQAQRNLLASLKDHPELLVRTHNWFGSYLLYSYSNSINQFLDQSEEETEESVEIEAMEPQESSGTVSLSLMGVPNQLVPSNIMVSHLRGRHFDPGRVYWPESRLEFCKGIIATKPEQEFTR